MAGGDDDTARKLQRLQDYNDQSQHPPPPHSQHLPPVQRTHAGFQHAMSPPGGDHAPPPHQNQGPHTPVHHHLPPMVDPALGGGGNQLAPIHTPTGPPPPPPPPHMQFPQTPESAQESADRQKGRQLSNTKRAAQNRAAQRAFRQRKEIHIKQLENKVGELDPLKRQVHSLQQDNYALRGYLITMLEMCINKGYEIPPNIPSMQNLQSGPPPPPPLESPSHDAHHDGDSASAQLHDQQAQYQDDDDDAEMGGAGPADPRDNGDTAPTAPMQNIAQQAMNHGGEHGRPGPGAGPNHNPQYVPRHGAQVDSKIDPAVTGA